MLPEILSCCRLSNIAALSYNAPTYNEGCVKLRIKPRLLTILSMNDLEANRFLFAFTRFIDTGLARIVAIWH